MRKKLILSLAVVLAGCAPCKKCPYMNTMQIDSIYVNTRETVTVHDTLIKWQIPEGSSNAVVPDTDTSFLQTGLAESEAWVKDGKLYHNIRNRSDLSLPILIPVPTKIIEAEHGLLRTRTVQVEKELSKWQKVTMCAGKLSIGVIAALILATFIALIIKAKSFIR